MPAYVVFIRESVTDEAEMNAYSAMVANSFEGRDVEFLATYGAHQTFEGPPIDGAVILEFPDTAAAVDWYESPTYQEAAKHRFRGARYRAFVIAGRQS